MGFSFPLFLSFPLAPALSLVVFPLSLWASVPEGLKASGSAPAHREHRERSGRTWADEGSRTTQGPDNRAKVAKIGRKVAKIKIYLGCFGVSSGFSDTQRGQKLIYF